MVILIRSARIIDTGSPHHKQVKDILIVDGKIIKIGVRLPKPARAKEIKADNLHVSLGWVDMNANLADPGFEQKETIETGCRAAAFGGFTHICCLPNTAPVTQTKAQIEYILGKAEKEMVAVHPLGAVTLNCDGKDLAEMYDMHQAGAIAFTDGLKPGSNAGLVERALLYVKAFGGLIINHPEDKSVSKNGAMNEGTVSTRMGLPGAPAVAEEIAVNRDIYVLEYTGSRLHFLGVSLKRSVDLIRAAKRRGLQLTASANAYNLMLDENTVTGYNTNYKVNPHLRTKEDINALVKGISDGTIDTLCSAHNPQDEECKKLEFDKADFGMIGLETCYAVANTALQGKVDTETLVQLLAANPRKILGLGGSIKEGSNADFTLFNPALKWTFAETDIQSRSKNTPFVGVSLVGKALGVINKGKLQLN